jgi:glycosyltransferase involved in cell wall biosynthesis
MDLLRVVTVRSRRGAYGGPADTALSQARLLGAAGITVDLFSGVLRDDEPEIPDLENVRVTMVRVRRLAPIRGFVAVGSLRAALRLSKSCRNARAVHVSLGRELIPLTAATLALLLRRPLIVQPHGMLTARTSRGHRALDVLVRPILRRAAAVIALTPHEKNALDAWARRRLPTVVIGNPTVADIHGRAACADPTDAIFVGRIEARKRVDDFLAAAEFAQDRGWPDNYAIVGPIQGDAEAFLTRVDRTGNVSYRGPVSADAVPGQLLSARVFVLPSRNEPWGNVLVMALGLGIPVVVTASAALAATVRESLAGYVVEDADPSGLAGAVHTLLDNADRWRAASQAASVLYWSTFSDEIVRERLAEVIQGVLA